MKYTRHRNACDVDRKFTDHLFMCAAKIRREAGKEVMSAGNGFDDEAFRINRMKNSVHTSYLHIYTHLH